MRILPTLLLAAMSAIARAAEPPVPPPPNFEAGAWILIDQQSGRHRTVDAATHGNDDPLALPVRVLRGYFSHRESIIGSNQLHLNGRCGKVMAQARQVVDNIRHDGKQIVHLLARTLPAQREAYAPACPFGAEPDCLQDRGRLGRSTPAGRPAAGGNAGYVEMNQ